MILCTVSVTMAVIVLNLHNRTPDTYTMPTAVSRYGPVLILILHIAISLCCCCCYRAMLRRAWYCHGKLSLRPSVRKTSRYRGHIGWNTSKIISRPISQGCSLSADHNTPVDRSVHPGFAPAIVRQAFVRRSFRSFAGRAAQCR